MGLIRRDIAGDVSTFPSTFSSYDNCMSKNICKIPFIVLWVIVGLIVFSILWCFLRCCLCGYRCCACCCGGCGGRREKRSDREILQPPPIIVQQPAYHQPPQYAYFGSHNDDALPAMPSLEKTQRIKVPAKDELEMGPVGPINAQDSEGCGYNQPLADLRFPNHGLKHPTPVCGYEQNGYDRQTQYPSNLDSGSPMYSTVPPALQSFGRQEGSIPQQRNIFYQEPSNYQQMQPSWDGHESAAQNPHNDYQANPYQYQGPRNQYTPDVSNHHNKRRQEEWAIV